MDPIMTGYQRLNLVVRQPSSGIFNETFYTLFLLMGVWRNRMKPKINASSQKKAMGRELALKSYL